MLDSPKLRILKSSDTQWPPYERYARTVQSNYTAIGSALEHMYSSSHKLEALGIRKHFAKSGKA